MIKRSTGSIFAHRLSLLLVVLFLSWGWRGVSVVYAQINTDRVMLMGRNALYYEDYVLAIQRFNMVVNAKPWISDSYFYRGLAKFYLEDYPGAEIDCSHALERNPYLANYYGLRALCRINQERYALAEEDYQKLLHLSPLDRNSWYNMVLCQIEQEKYASADSALDVMIKQWPKIPSHYTLKAQVAFARKDTLQGELWVDRALDVNEFDGNAWSMKAMLHADRKEFAKAEAALDKAILQSPRNVPLYVNRALARYNQDNLRGAMSDYDAAIELQPGNYLARFNRGLLRANVGADNLAIEDFNHVLEVEPDNMIALYNRALLLDNTGDYQGAIRDISAVIQEYPQFWEGYRKRASIRRKIGDRNGAERDEFKILQAQMAVAAGTYKQGKTRKKSERTIEDYQKLVVEDERETENEYESEYRGKVQNQKSELKPMPLYVLTYYKKVSQVNGYTAYASVVDSLNNSHVLPSELFLSAQERTLSEQQVERHLSAIDSLADKIGAQPANHVLLFQRAMDYYHVKDFEGAIADMNAFLQDFPSDVLGLWLRAQSRMALLQANAKQAAASDLRLGYLMAQQDFTQCVSLCPQVAYAHYNLGAVQMELGELELAVASYTKAIECDPHFPDAYYNRGVANLKLGRKEQGLSDLSQAGEYGLYHAYSLIKQYSANK